ncbi:hypothetical protein GALMADRAFT_904158 [Galerina marginata CBS 339.88]|uniref:Uncharacterized protein n=1 Tax=Galerina marginata (strain CBS 339.88) TaxID=685588 RepID=A0A067STI0_GALM3|nr:hypothetical protein GALMADRAFT_904158 [Galerina marginata CBS 339.88]
MLWSTAPISFFPPDLPVLLALLMSRRASPVVPTRQGSMAPTYAPFPQYRDQLQHTDGVVPNNFLPYNPYRSLTSTPVPRQGSVAPVLTGASEPVQYAGQATNYSSGAQNFGLAVHAPANLSSRNSEILTFSVPLGPQPQPSLSPAHSVQHNIPQAAHRQPMGSSSFTQYPPSSPALSRQGSMSSNYSDSSEIYGNAEYCGCISQPIRSNSADLPRQSSSLSLRRQATMTLAINSPAFDPQHIMRGDTLILSDNPPINRPDSRKENRRITPAAGTHFHTSSPSLQATKAVVPHKTNGLDRRSSMITRPLTKTTSAVFKSSGLKSHTTLNGPVQYIRPLINGSFWLDERNSTAAIPDGCFQEMVPAPNFISPKPRQILYEQCHDIFSLKFEPHLYDVNCDVFGVPLRDCLNGIGMKDADERIFKGWHDAGHTYIRLEITWPGYPKLLWGMDFSIFDLDQQLITRREMAYKIACHYQNLCEIIELNSLEKGDDRDPPLLGRDSRWRIGQGGYSFDRMRLAGLSRTADNIWQAKIWVITDDDFPQDPDKFFMLGSIHDF